MTDTLRLILEIGKKRRVVAGAMDWPGLDRWETSEDAALVDSAIGWEEPEGTVAQASDGAKVAFVERQEIERRVAVGEDDDRRVSEPKPQIPVAIDDVDREPDVLGIHRLEAIGAGRDLTDYPLRKASPTLTSTHIA